MIVDFIIALGSFLKNHAPRGSKLFFQTPCIKASVFLGPARKIIVTKSVNAGPVNASFSNNKWQ